MNCHLILKTNSCLIRMMNFRLNPKMNFHLSWKMNFLMAYRCCYLNQKKNCGEECNYRSNGLGQVNCCAEEPSRYCYVKAENCCYCEASGNFRSTLQEPGGYYYLVASMCGFQSLVANWWGVSPGYYCSVHCQRVEYSCIWVKYIPVRNVDDCIQEMCRIGCCDRYWHYSCSACWYSDYSSFHCLNSDYSGLAKHTDTAFVAG